MPSKDLNLRLVGTDVSASKTLRGVGDHAETASHRIGGAFGKVGAAIGGEFGDILTKVGDGFDRLGEHGGKMGAKIAAGGGALAGVGVLLTGIGSKEKEAGNQLNAAIAATGQSASSFKDEIEKTVKSQENFAHSAVETKGALATLTAATNDPKKAMQEMGVVANLAAAKHISLGDAASMVAKILNGAGAKTLKAYGITMDSTKLQTTAFTSAQKAHERAITTLAVAQKKLTDLTAIDAGKTKLSAAQQIALRNAHDAVAKAQLGVKTTTENLAVAQKGMKTTTQNADAALGLLSNKLSGQASASVDSWGGKLRVLRTKVGDFVGEVGNKFGPAITGVGTAMLAGGSIMQGFAARSAATAAAVATASAEQAAAAEASAVAVAAADAGVIAAQEAVAVAATGSAAEIALADAGMIAANEAAAVAAEAAAALEVTASEEAGAASSLALGPIGLAVAGVVGVATLAAGALGLFGKSAHDQIKPTQAFTDAILNDNDALGVNTRKLLENDLQKSGAYDTAMKVNVGQKTLTDALMGNVPAITQVTAATKTATAAYDKNYAALVAQHHLTGQVVPSSLGLAGLAYDKMTGAQKRAYDAAIKLNGQVGVVSKTLAVNQHAADNLTAAEGKLTSKQRAALPTMEAHLVKLGATAARAHAIAVEYSLLPAAKRTKVTLDDYASAKIDTVARKLAALRDRAVTLQINQVMNNRTALADLHTAGGSNFFPGGMTEIAEREPEAVYLPRGSKVVPQSRMHTGGTQQSIELHYHAPQYSGASNPALARALVAELEQWVRSGGRIAGVTR